MALSASRLSGPGGIIDDVIRKAETEITNMTLPEDTQNNTLRDY